MWMVRAGRGGDRVDDFLERGVAGFLDDRLPSLADVKSKDEILVMYAQHYPKEKEGSRAAWASQLYRLITEMKVDDTVIVGDPQRRRYLMGKITSNYVHLEDFGGVRLHARRVEWTSEVSRDALQTETKNTLGSTLTIFKVKAEAAKDIEHNGHPIGTSTNVAAPSPSEVERSQEKLSEIGDETFQKANEFIEDQIDQLSPMQMQHLVAGILRAMGYRTTVSEEGPDRGVDVFASPDGLGLQDPRVFVEVKHRTAATGSAQIRSFLGGRRKGDRCLYVSTGGFSRDAQYEADRAEVALQLVTLPRLRQLVLDFYEKLDGPTRALVPLKQFYWPVASVAR